MEKQSPRKEGKGLDDVVMCWELSVQREVEEESVRCPVWSRLYRHRTDKAGSIGGLADPMPAREQYKGLVWW